MPEAEGGSLKPVRAAGRGARSATPSPTVEPVVTEPAGPAVLIPFNGERDGQRPRTHSIEEPLPTVTTGGAGQKGLAEPMLVGYYGQGRAHRVDAPIGTLTGKDRYGLVTPDLAAHADGLPIGSVTPWGLKIGPNLYLDILFRMLKIHELAQGQGFPADYRFHGTQEDQIKADRECLGGPHGRGAVQGLDRVTRDTEDMR